VVSVDIIEITTIIMYREVTHNKVSIILSGAVLDRDSNAVIPSSTLA
jgi:hypothetical protein